MAQVTGRKVATTPIVPTPSGGNVINSWNTSDNKETNAPSMKIVKDDLDAINDNLTSKLLYTEITSLTTIGDVIDYIVANENIPLGTTKKYSIYNTTLNGYDIEITHANLTVERYTGTALSNHGKDNYTFYKDGGASTVTSPFKGLPSCVVYGQFKTSSDYDVDLSKYNVIIMTNTYGGDGDARRTDVYTIINSVLTQVINGTYVSPSLSIVNGKLRVSDANEGITVTIISY